MKKLVILLSLMATVAFVGCSKYDDSEIVLGLEDAKNRLDELEDWKMTIDKEVESLKTIT